MSRAPAGAPRINGAGSSVLLTSVFFGLVTGLVEVIVLAIRKFALDEFIGRSPHVVWMAPLFYVVLFAVLAIPLFFAARKWPRGGANAAVFLWAFLSVLSTLILIAYNRLHNIALLVLAVGISWQILRWSRGHGAFFRRLVWRGTLIMFCLVATAAAVVAGGQQYQQRSRLNALGAARAGAPNVLFIILDTVRAASLSLYGYHRPTSPMLEKFAQRGVIFERAIAPSPWTLPSHASLFTGLPAADLSADWLEPLDEQQRTLAEAFRDRGYDTGAFVANLIYGTWETGLARGFRRYSDYVISPGQVVMNASFGRFVAGRWKLREWIGNDEVLGRRNAADINQDFLDWVGDERQRPFFAFLNYYDAHDPYLPPDEFYRAMSGRDRENRLSPLRRVPIPARRTGVSEEALRIERDSYDGALAYLDQQLGRLLAELETRGLLENTLVVITADHGEEFGEHGLWYHGNSLYLPALHVPLLLVMPERLPAGVRVAGAVSLTNLAATITELAIPDAADFPGVSLRPSWEGSAPVSAAAVSSVRKGVRLPAWYPISEQGLTSVVQAGKHYIRNAAGREELYDIERDAWETRDISREPTARVWLPRLRALLSADRVQNAEPRE